MLMGHSGSFTAAQSPQRIDAGVVGARPESRPAWGWLTLVVALLVALAIMQGDWNDAALFTASSLALSIICVSVLFLHEPGNPLAPTKIVTALYAVSFAIAPLWLSAAGLYSHPYFGFRPQQLMGATALVALAGYLCMLAGYVSTGLAFSDRSSREQRASAELPIATRRAAFICACLLGAVGAISYGGLITRVGGIGYLLGYTGGRADILSGVYGGWFWGAHLLFAAYGFAAIAIMHRRPLVCFVLAAALAMTFLPLQGRDLVVAPFFCWLVLFHALRRPIGWRTVGIGALAVLVISAFVGAFRNAPDYSADSRVDAALSTFTQEWSNSLIGVVAMNIEQLDSAMVAVSYVEKERKTTGIPTLLGWAEPIDRQLFADSITTTNAGRFMDLLLFPEHYGWNTALSPSLIGELYLAAAWAGVIVGMIAFGVLLRILMQWSTLGRARVLMFAAYPFVIYMTAKMLVDGTQHAFRPLLITAAVAACSLILDRRGAGT